MVEKDSPTNELEKILEETKGMTTHEMLIKWSKEDEEEDERDRITIKIAGLKDAQKILQNEIDSLRDGFYRMYGKYYDG